MLGLVCLSTQSQVLIDRLSKDMGTLQRGDVFYTDFEIENKGSDKVFILRAEEASETDVKFSSKQIDSQSKAFVRIQYNPKSIGAFKRTIPVYLSAMQEPLNLQISGVVESFDASYDPACPEFGTEKARESFELRIYVGDHITYEAISGAKLVLKNPGNATDSYVTSDFGFARAKLPIGLYHWTIQADGFEAKEMEYYVNRNTREMNVYLKRLDDLGYENSLIAAKELARDSAIPKPKDSLAIQQVAQNEVYLSHYFPEAKYKANNLVFLIDVSESMRLSGKMQILKAVLIALVKELRPIDKLAIIAYSDTSKLILDSRYLTNKAIIIEQIEALQAEGKTQATQGLEEAYRMVYKHYISGGNNQIFLSSDGVYSKKDSEQSVQLVRSNFGKGVIVSTLGIKAERDNLKKLKKIARYGQGRGLNLVEASEAATDLLEDVRRNSRK